MNAVFPQKEGQLDLFPPDSDASLQIPRAFWGRCCAAKLALQYFLALDYKLILKVSYCHGKRSCQCQAERKMKLAGAPRKKSWEGPREHRRPKSSHTPWYIWFSPVPPCSIFPSFFFVALHLVTSPSTGSVASPSSPSRPPPPHFHTLPNGGLGIRRDREEKRAMGSCCRVGVVLMLAGLGLASAQQSNLSGAMVSKGRGVHGVQCARFSIGLAGLAPAPGGTKHLSSVLCTAVALV